MRLHQLLSVEKDTKAAHLRVVTDVHQKFQKAALLSGISRRYRATAEGGEQLPAVSTLVQVRVEDAMGEVRGAFVTLLDLIAVKETANQGARADIVVDGRTLATGVPVCALLAFEKQATDLVTMVDALPVLDPSEQWGRDDAQNCWATAAVETHRTKKLPKVVEKSPATDKHPAQVEVFHEDVVVGYWSTTKFSGAIPATRKADLKRRALALKAAIKIAREEANSIKVEDRKVGAALVDYIFNG